MRRMLMILIVSLLTANLNLSIFSQTTEKKLEFEVSGGLAFIPQQDNLYSRITGTGDLISQYAGYYQLPFTVEPSGGEFAQIKRLLPLNLSLNYQFAHKWYLKIGFEFGSGKAVSSRKYTIQWDNFPEIYDYKFNYMLSSLMPYVGVETRFSDFAIYANLGFNITSFSFTEDFEYSENGSKFVEKESYDVDGKAIALMLGAKYSLKLGKSLKFLVKAEYLYLDIASFSGTKKSSAGTINGTLYSYSMNPYGIAAVDYWDLYETAPASGITGLSRVKELGMDLSCFRILIGFTF